MIAPPEPDCWLHPDVEVRRSPISGHGLFATAPVTAGTVVSRLGGRLVSTEALHQLFTAAARDPGHPYIDSITVGTDLHLVLPCRGVVTGNDWRRPDLRERYGKHWVPALLARIQSDEAY